MGGSRHGIVTVGKGQVQFLGQGLSGGGFSAAGEAY
jgi:hypothetical protein